ncbi:MAG TPA: type II secretion system F family protein [Thermoplasmata archaeon]|nr:type II secretion system F family protein [Thermoplasmata archaeon]
MAATTPTVRAGSSGTPGNAPNRAVRLKRGAQPTHSTMSGFQRWAWSTFRARVLARPPDPALDENLVKAHIRMRSDEYMAMVYATTVVVAIATVLAGAVVGFLFVSAGDAFLGILIGVLLPIFGTIGTFFVMQSTPSSKAKERGRKIDRKISASMSFVSAMSSADVNIDQIFKELGQQKVYGEVAEEAAWITRDTELLGVDILTAIRNGAQRTPSKRFQDFLQGVVTTATSGGQLKPYFLLKAEQFERENKLEQLQRVETMGLLAETFVTVVVAFPLFLVIIIAIFAIIGGGGIFLIDVLWGIVGAMIPLAQFGFIFFMYTLASEMN